jgi:hypothetical protein
MSKQLLLASIVLGATALALGFGLAGDWLGVAVVVALGLLWLIGQWRGPAWTSSVGLVGFVLLAAAGLLLGLGPGWMLLGLVAALTAWDLDGFLRRLDSVEWVERRSEVERRHLLRLLLVDALGLALAALALGVRLDLSFGYLILLGLVAAWGLGRAVGFLRRESD